MKRHTKFPLNYKYLNLPDMSVCPSEVAVSGLRQIPSSTTNPGQGFSLSETCLLYL